MKEHGLLLFAAVLAACSQSRPNHIVVAITVDWEGAYVSPDGIQALENLRTSLGGVPVTHFPSAAYFTKAKPDPRIRTLIGAIHAGDEVGMHVHAWRSLAVASEVEPKVSPSFLTGTHEVIVFEDGDVGFDTDLDVYTTSELRALLRTSRQLFEQQGIVVSSAFRAGGYLGTPKVLRAIRDEGYLVDSSSIDYRVLDATKDMVFRERLAELWPSIGPLHQPYLVEPGEPLLEMPITATSDYNTADQFGAVFSAARERLQTTDQDVIVVLGINQETAVGSQGILETIAKLRDLGEQVEFVTISQAANVARNRSL